MEEIMVFSATTFADRGRLGADITSWMHSAGATITRMEITQSSDASHHCIAVTAVCRPGPPEIHHGGKAYSRVDIYCATMARERADLGDRIGELPAGSYDLIVRQSSGAEFHCLTIAVLSGGSPSGGS